MENLKFQFYWVNVVFENLKFKKESTLLGKMPGSLNETCKIEIIKLMYKIIKMIIKIK
jgi:hypothetical protein